ncbi:MAG: hypothetical protein K2J82_01545 [Muribaculaceae bacterium]|nr:hypothetical protein [Muribaculaceae bacterium]MDE6753277.1 hypothetical protein [Muribaculaceae bacterium]
MKRNLMVIIVTLLLLPLASYANKAYKSMSQTSLYEMTERGTVKKICEIAKGDTIFATARTEAYIADHQGERLKYIPFEYKGKNGYVSLTWFYPIKLDPSEKLNYVQTASLSNRNPMERFLVPQMEWAINIYSGPTRWLYVILTFSAITLILWVLYFKYEKSVLFWAFGGSLVAISIFEVIYALSFQNLFMWFIKPDTAGGWGMAILNFCLLAIVTGIQTGGIYYVCGRCLDEIKKAPGWIKKASLMPVLLGIVLIILPWLDNGDMPGTTYIYVICSLLIPALSGMAWCFLNKQWTEGVLFPILYLLASAGLTLSIMITGLMIFVIGVVIVLAILGLSAIFGGLSVLFAGKEVKVITNDGRTVRGTTNLDGTVSGYDGKTYEVE